MVEKIRGDDFIVIVGRMGKGTFPVTVSHGPDARNVRTQLIIDLDVTMLIDRNAGLLESQVIGIGATSYCEQEMGPVNLGTAVCAIERYYHFVALFLDGQALCVKAQVDAFTFQYLAHRGGDIFVFAMN